MRRPRKPASPGAALNALVVGLLALGALTASGVALKNLAGDADVFDYALSLEAGTPPQAEYIQRFASEHRLNTPRANCGDTITRAQLTITLAQYQAAAQTHSDRIETALAEALVAAAHRLACNPMDGNAWLQLARLNDLAKKPSAQTAAQVRMSALAAPSEAWILEPRLDLETALILGGEPDLALQYQSDLSKFVDFEATSRIAAVYVDHLGMVRQRLRPLIASQPQPRRERIVAEIDRLGVDYTKP